MAARVPIGRARRARAHAACSTEPLSLSLSALSALSSSSQLVDLQGAWAPMPLNALPFLMELLPGEDFK